MQTCLRSSAYLVILLVLLIPAFGSADDDILIPGGTECLSQWYGGLLDPDADRFILGLNRMLLEQFDPGNDWQKVPSRVALREYEQDLKDLRREFGSRIAVGTEPREARERLERLAGFLGYKVRFQSRPFTLEPVDGALAARRRRLAHGLGWNMSGLANALSASKQLVLEVRDQTVPSPVPFAILNRFLERSLDSATALETLGKDQKLSYMMEAIRQMPSATLNAVSTDMWKWLYANESESIYRYAFSIYMPNGRLLLPGGASAAPVWNSLLKASPDNGQEYLKRLLSRNDSRIAYFWQALVFAPPDTVAVYLGTGPGAGLSDNAGYLKRLVKRFEDTGGAISKDLDFAAFIRSVGTTESGHLDLPGGPAPWLLAIRREEAPRDLQALNRMVMKSRKMSDDDGDLLLQALSESVKIGPAYQSVLPGMIRVANMFPYDRELLTPENVILLVYGATVVPRALGILDELRLEDPTTVRNYLLSLAHMEGLGRSAETEIYLANFQGGVEWIRLMARAGKIPAKKLEEALRSWSQIHTRFSDPFAAGPDEFRWVADLLGSLPEASDSWAGRGPVERSFFASLIGSTDPQRFQFEGIDYSGNRGSDLSAAYLQTLVKQNIVSADQLVGIRRQMENLRKSCEIGNVEGVRRVSSELQRSMGDLPHAVFSDALKDKSMLERASTVDRTRILERLGRIAAWDSADKLTKGPEAIDELERLMVRELRPFLLSPAYMIAIGDQPSLLAQDENLIYKHLVFASLDSNAPPGTPWSGASAYKNEDPAIGTQVVGYVGSVPEAVAEFTSANDRAVGARQSIERQAVRYRNWTTTDWASVDPGLTRLVSLAVSAGRYAIGQIGERKDGPWLDFAATRIPRGRLERKQISPSECFLLGLGLLAGDEFGPRPDLPLPPELENEFRQATDPLGPEWRRKMHVLGVATPMLNGRGYPWIGWWPPYEALEHVLIPKGLTEREAIDLHVVVLNYLGKNGLPGEVGRDIMPDLIRRASAETRYASTDHWEAWLHWINGLDDSVLQENLRRCFSQGLYQAQF